MQIEFKVGRYILNISEKDLILDNGTCYQIITQKVGRSALHSSSPVMSKKLFKELQKKEMIYTNKELKQKADAMYRIPGMTFWKFNIEKIITES